MPDEIDIFSFSDDPFEKKGTVFTHGIESRVALSINFIKENYEQKNKLYESVTFVDYIMSEAIKADLTQLSRVGFFPSNEAEIEFDYSLKHALVGSYKAAYGALRRALEMTVISVYLVNENVNQNEALEWLRSEKNTPFFSGMIQELTKEGRYKSINELYNWKDDIKSLYWKLSDFIHVKGMDKGYKRLNKINVFLGSTSLPNVSLITLEGFLNDFVNTVGQVVSVLTLYNPIILVGLPLFEKFGFNTPFSGYLTSGQSAKVNAIIPLKYADFFSDVAANDEEVLGIVKDINNRSDLTTEEIEGQADDL